MNLALVTPWPPDTSGIADYSFELATWLRDAGERLTVFTGALAPLALPGVPVKPVPVGTCPDLGSFDLVLHQFGNSFEHHAFMPPLMERWRGVVHLHDVVLHHFYAGQAQARGGASAYFDLLRSWYGAATAEAVAALFTAIGPVWEDPVVQAIPLCEEALRHADACIVHSLYALRHIRRVLPALPVGVVQQVLATTRRPALPPRAPGAPLRIGVLGHVTPNRRADVVIKALADAWRGEPVELHVVGAGGAYLEECRALVARTNLGPVVRFGGRVAGPEFKRSIASMDLVVSLRHPTMGEASGVVVQAIQFGRSAIVSDVGWYAELPAPVIRLPVDSLEQQRLSGHFRRFLSDPDYVAAHAEGTRSLARSDFDIDAVCERYRSILHRCAAARSALPVTPREAAADALAAALADLRVGPGPDERQLRDSLLAPLQGFLA